jgi:hypothetical protein
MRTSTAEWLRPLKEKAERELPLDVIEALLMQATMPADEAEDSDFVKWAMKKKKPGTDIRTIDWIEFGQLLRKKLERWEYPQFPSEDETQ